VVVATRSTAKEPERLTGRAQKEGASERKKNNQENQSGSLEELQKRDQKNARRNNQENHGSLKER